MNPPPQGRKNFHASEHTIFAACSYRILDCTRSTESVGICVFVAQLYASWQSRTHIVECDPSGTKFWLPKHRFPALKSNAKSPSWKATCIGNNHQAAINLLKQEYKSPNLQEAKTLCMKILSKTLDVKLSAEKIELATMTRVGEKTVINILERGEVEKLVQAHEEAEKEREAKEEATKRRRRRRRKSAELMLNMLKVVEMPDDQYESLRGGTGGLEVLVDATGTPIPQYWVAGRRSILIPRGQIDPSRRHAFPRRIAADLRRSQEID